MKNGGTRAIVERPALQSPVQEISDPNEPPVRQDLTNTGNTQKIRIADDFWGKINSWNGHSSGCPQAIAGNENKFNKEAVFSDFETLRLENRRSCIRYGEKNLFIDNQKAFLFTVGIDLASFPLWSPSREPFPSLRGTQYRSSRGQTDLDSVKVYRPFSSQYQGSLLRSRSGLFETDPRMANRSRETKQAKHLSDLDPHSLKGDLRKSQNKNPASDPLSTRVGTLERRFQVFVKLPEGKSKFIWVIESDTVKKMQERIMKQIGFPIRFQNLIYQGRALQDTKYLWEYQIEPLSTIILNLRMRGGASVNGRNNNRAEGSGTNARKKPSNTSFKDILQGKNKEETTPNQTGMDARPYIVEELDHTPVYNIDTPETEDYCNIYERQAIICRFNSFWPKPVDLFNWIFKNWTLQCEIHLCSKGFFIVKFLTEADRDAVIQEGPWFWGSTGLFITPWSPEFDANSMVVTKMPVWVRLHNLPIHLWTDQVLAGIGNTIGRFIKWDTQRLEERIFTYARICVEVDLSKGLPDQIQLKHRQRSWTQGLDYENTAFRCRICRQTGHLQNTCPAAKKDSRRKRKTEKQVKGWQFPPPVTDDEEEEEMEITNTNQPSQMNKEPTTEDKITQEQIETTHANTTVTMDMGNNKRQHISDSSDSDKEIPQLVAESALALISPTEPQGIWKKVEKKKGRKL